MKELKHPWTHAPSFLSNEKDFEERSLMEVEPQHMTNVLDWSGHDAPRRHNLPLTADVAVEAVGQDVGQDEIGASLST